MLQTIEIEIDTNGHIHIVEPVARLPAGRGLLTLLQDISAANKPITHQPFDGLFGILTATHSVSLEDMERTISQQGQERLNDCN